MAKIVLGIGASHGPLSHLAGPQWVERGNDDRRSKQLNTIDGRLLSYDALVAERGEPFAHESSVAFLTEQAEVVQTALVHLADELEACRPDVVLVVGDDQGELFERSNMPALAVFYGKDIATHPWDTKGLPDFWHPVLKGTGLDDYHVYEGHPALSRAVLEGLIDAEFDVTAVESVTDPAVRGFGHAFGFVVERLFRGRSIPMVPVLLNTYFPPNVPRPSRCIALGQALRSVLEAADPDLRVAVVASGGLSHFLCEEELDRHVMSAITNGDMQALSDLPREALIAGSSEILNWIVVANACAHLRVDWQEYLPVRRTPAGTGNGMAFMVWKA